MPIRRTGWMKTLCCVLLVCSMGMAEDIVKVEQSVFVLENSPQVMVVDVKLGKIRSNERMEALITLNNSSSRPLKIHSVDRSCSCLSVDVPSGMTVSPGGSSELVFRIGPERDVKALKKAFSVILKCSGPCEAISLTLKSEITDFIGFFHGSHVCTIPPGPSTTNEVTVSLPILVSEDIDLTRWNVVLSPEISKFANARFSQRAGLSEVLISYDRSKATECKDGSRSIAPKGANIGKSAVTGENYRCQLFFEQGQTIEVLPRTLMFVATDGTGYEARAIVKISRSLGDSFKINSVVCKSNNGEDISLDWKEIRPGYASMRLSLKSVEDLEQAKQLKFSIETTEGPFVCLTNFRFAN